MQLIGKKEYQERAEVLKAMAHPSRLRMLDALSAGEHCVCELTALVGADMSTVSKHLGVMKKVGIVEEEKRGRKVFYRLRVPCVLSFFGCIERVVQSQRDKS